MATDAAGLPAVRPDHRRYGDDGWPRTGDGAGADARAVTHAGALAPRAGQEGGSGVGRLGTGSSRILPAILGGVPIAGQLPGL